MKSVVLIVLGIVLMLVAVDWLATLLWKQDQVFWLFYPVAIAGVALFVFGIIGLFGKNKK